MLASRTHTTLCKRILIMVSIFPLVLTKIHYSMNNTHNISSCDITPTLMYCNYRWYSNPSFFFGLVCGMFSIVTVAPPYWYVGTHGPLLVHIGACLGVICTYIALLITLLCSITMTPLVAAQHNNAVELIVPLLIMRASLPFICQLTRVTTRTRFSWVVVE